jgi:putative transposase
MQAKPILSDLMRIFKGESSERINKQQFSSSVFRWQEGFGAFSYSRSQINDVAVYIEKQEEHHRKKTFLDEYKQFLDHFGIAYNEQFIFKPLE